MYYNRIAMITLENFFRMFRTPEFDEYGSVYLTEYTASEGKLSLLFEVNPGNPNGQRDSWTVECFQPVDYRLSPLGPINSIELKSEHPLLWSYQNVWSTIHIYGRSISPDELFGELYRLQTDLMDGHYTFKVNYEVLTGGFGFLCNTPTPITDEYMQLLARKGITVSTLEMGFRPVASTPAPDRLQIFTLDRAYIIAPEFIVKMTSHKESNSPYEY